MSKCQFTPSLFALAFHISGCYSMPLSYSPELLTDHKNRGCETGGRNRLSEGEHSGSGTE